MNLRVLSLLLSLVPVLVAAQQPAPARSEEPAVKAKATPPAAAAPAKPATAAPKKGFKTMDRLELDATAVTGNRELPKVMVVVPWKKSDIGDLVGRPANSLLNEVLEPVDREVFRREVQYYQAIDPNRPHETRAPEAPAGASSPQPEK